MFRQGVREMLSTDEGLEVVGETGDGEQAVALARELKPDVVILDVEMPGPGAQPTMEHLLEISPRPQIIIVTMYDEPRLVRELLAQGASAYLVKSASMQELLAAVHMTVESPINRRGENKILVVPREVLERTERGTMDALSGRELEVLLQAARGLSNRQIAYSLHLSEATVKRHLANVYNKIKVRSRGEAMNKALHEGWFSTRDLTRESDLPERHD
jgi:DNA-binding NarL/FixJ family response regulator